MNVPRSIGARTHHVERIRVHKPLGHHAVQQCSHVALQVLSRLSVLLCNLLQIRSNERRRHDLSLGVPAHPAPFLGEHPNDACRSLLDGRLRRRAVGPQIAEAKRLEVSRRRSEKDA